MRLHYEVPEHEGPELWNRYRHMGNSGHQSCDDHFVYLCLCLPTGSSVQKQRLVDCRKRLRSISTRLSYDLND